MRSRRTAWSFYCAPDVALHGVFEIGDGFEDVAADFSAGYG
jgi:hypothetical protein